MSASCFLKAELASAIARGVRQCVFIGAKSLREGCEKSPDDLKLFAIDEEQATDSSCVYTFVATQFASETLASALQKTEFDKLKSSLFVWLGAGYRTVDAAISALSFIASLPKGSGVVLDYTVEQTSLGPLTHTALDALASRICKAGGVVMQFIQPQAVSALLRGLGFQNVVDFAPEPASSHLVSATI